MNKFPLTLLLVLFNSNALADSLKKHETYYCKDLKQDIENGLAVTPEWRIRSSIYKWQEHKGRMPKLDISLPSFVYFQCEQHRNSARSVNDIVFDALDQAAFANPTKLLTNHLQ